MRATAHPWADNSRCDCADQANALLASGAVRDERAVKAEALWEAADDLYGDARAAGPHWHSLSVRDWLLGRADAIAEPQTHESPAQPTKG